MTTIDYHDSAVSDELLATMISVASAVKVIQEQLKNAEWTAGQQTLSAETATKELLGELRRFDLTAITAAAKRGGEDAVEKTPRQLQTAIEDLEYLSRASQKLQERAYGARRWKLAGITLAALLSVSTAFIGGIYVMRTDMVMTNPAGCRWLGGEAVTFQGGQEGCLAYF